MLILHCPYCGVDADETDLAPGGEAHLKRSGPGTSDEAFESYLFHRQNPRGVHFERWRHAMGCGKWFHAARCTATLEIRAGDVIEGRQTAADITAWLTMQDGAYRIF